MLKNRLTYGIVVFVLFIFIYLHDASMTYMAFYAALILPLVSFILAHISINKIYVSEKLSHDFIAKREPTEYKIKIHNRGFLPCFFAYIHFNFEEIGLDADVAEAYLSIKSFGSHESSVKISGKYRGIYEVGVKNMIVYDFLGLFKIKPEYDRTLKLTITPQVINIPEVMLEATQQGETIVKRHMPGKDYTIAFELRAYQPTDTYKQIHWKATAKKSELISKDPQEIEQLATVFFVDNLRIPKALPRMLEREDKMMDVVVSAMSYCHQLSHRMSLQALSGEHSGFTTDFTRLFHHVSTLPFGSFGDIHHVLNTYLSSGNTLENVFIFAQVVDKDLISSLQSYQLLGSKITIFLFGTATTGVMRQIEALNIQCIRFD